MSYLDKLSYKGKRVVVTGAASGMGDVGARILSELGGEVYAVDIKPVSAPVEKFVKTDLGDEDSVDAAVAAIGGTIDAIFNFAGLPGKPFSDEQTVLVNYVGHRHLTEQLLPRMSKGGAIVSITSLAGMAFLQKMADLMPAISVSGFKAGKEWLQKNPPTTDGYSLSKELLNFWTVYCAKTYALKHGVRINAIAPAVTETPLLPQFTINAGGEDVIKFYSGYLGRLSQPVEQAWPAVFLNSAAASFISGQILSVDAGLTSALMTGQVDQSA